MHVLVTGGTGELGSFVVPRLRDRGHHVVVATRTPRHDGEVRLDLTEPDLALPPAIDTVVHLAADARHLEEVDVRGTERLIAAAAAAGVGHLVLISIVGVDDHPFPFYRARRLAEGLVEAGSVPWSVLRATQFHTLPARMLGELRWPPVLPLPRGVRLQPVDPVVVADRLVALVDDGPAGRVADLGGPEVIDLTELVRREYRARGRRVALPPLPLPRRLGRAFRDGRMLVPSGGRGRTHADDLADRSPSPAPPDPLARLLRWIAVGVLATTAWMAIAPASFHDTVAAYGGFNSHLLRDLATATLPLGVAVMLAASRPSWRRPVLAFALLQNGLHLLNHVADVPLAETVALGIGNVALLASLEAVLAFAWLRSTPTPRRVA